MSSENAAPVSRVLEEKFEPYVCGSDYEDVYDVEKRYIWCRRKTVEEKLKDTKTTDEKSEAERKCPEVENLVGLALSGGGMRSASFNLGVLQGLSEKGVFPLVDYMSTVSGGGYIGSCLSSLLALRWKDIGAECKKCDDTHGDDFVFSVKREKFPFNPNFDPFVCSSDDCKNRTQGGNESSKEERQANKQVQHLRAKGNFITPRIGFFTLSTMQVGGLYFTGLFWTLFAFLTVMLFLAASHYFLADLIAPGISGENIVIVVSTPTSPAEQEATSLTAQVNISSPVSITLTRTGQDATSPLAGEVIIPPLTITLTKTNKITSTPEAAEVQTNALVSTLTSTPTPTARSIALADVPQYAISKQLNPPRMLPVQDESLKFSLPWAFYGSTLAVGIICSIVITLMLYIVSWIWKPYKPIESLDSHLGKKKDKLGWVKGLIRQVFIIFKRFRPKDDKIIGKLRGFFEVLVDPRDRSVEEFWNLVILRVILLLYGFFFLVFIVWRVYSTIGRQSGQDNQLYWLWMPVIFMLGGWLTTVVLYWILLWPSYAPWTLLYRSAIGTFMAFCLGGAIAAIGFALLALPYYFVVEDSSASPAAPAILAIVSFLWASNLANKLKDVSKLAGEKEKRVKLRPWMKKTLLAILVGMLLLSVFVFFEWMIELYLKIWFGWLLWVGDYWAKWGTFGFVTLVTLVLFAKRSTSSRIQKGSEFLVVLVLGAFGFIVYEAETSQMPMVILLVVLTLILLILTGFVNWNKLSPHYIYRDRLSDTFLKTEVVDSNHRVYLVRDHSNMQLTQLNPDGSTAPYHLIVTAINLQGSCDLAYKDLKADHFIFSRYYCGSKTTGYIPTKYYINGYLKLARAMTISGAAFSTAMGCITFFAQAFMMTILNARLGYWMVNPNKYSEDLKELNNVEETLKKLEDEEKQSRKKKSLEEQHSKLMKSLDNLAKAEWRIWWWSYLWDELGGQPNVRRTLVDLSDGGHTGDNIGLCPLLQRRCKLIIAGDAGCDPNYEFADLSRAIRRVYLDHNIDVQIDPEPLRCGEDKYSTASFVVGKIKYPPPNGETGYLLLLKPVLTNQPEDAQEVSLRRYSQEHCEGDDKFPHQTTVDQYYDSDQFEAYRRLGQITVKRAFSGLWLKNSKDFDSLQNHLEKLYKQANQKTDRSDIPIAETEYDVNLSVFS